MLKKRHVLAKTQTSGSVQLAYTGSKTSSDLSLQVWGFYLVDESSPTTPEELTELHISCSQSKDIRTGQDLLFLYIFWYRSINNFQPLLHTGY